MANKLNRSTVVIGVLLVLLLLVSGVLWRFVSYTREKNEREESVMMAQILANRMKTGIDVDQSRNQLIKMIEGRNGFAAVSAITALGGTGDKSNQTLDCILRAVKRREVFAMDREAVIALESIKPDREDVIDELIRQLDYERRDVSWFAADALGSIGKSAAKALPKLREKMYSTDQLLSSSSAKAVRLILEDIAKKGT